MPLGLRLSLCFLACITGGAINAAAGAYSPCAQDAERHSARAIELTAIAASDQRDRSDPSLNNPEHWSMTQHRDRRRRKRVGAIFGEGCLKTAEDFANAALVYQHGDTPEHFFQAFLWAKRAVDLGDSSQRELVAKGIDRFLRETNHKQLFGTQSRCPYDQPCCCLELVQANFPDSERTAYGVRTLAQALSWVDSMNAGRGCPSAKMCPSGIDGAPLDSPRGTVPGFW